MVFNLTLFCCLKQSFCSLIEKPCIKSVLGVFMVFLFGFSLFCFFFPGVDFLSPFVFVCALSSLQQCGLDLLLGWLVTPLPAKSSAGFLWCTEHGITN